MHPPHLQQCEEVYTVVRPPWRGLLTCRLPLCGGRAGMPGQITRMLKCVRVLLYSEWRCFDH